jgi:SNF2 family DNA or RNA helicase
MKLIWKHTGVSSVFMTDEGGNSIPTSDWDNYQDSFLSELSIVQELIENGFATKTEMSIDLEPDDLLSLPEIEKRLLDLPDDYPFSIYIEADGVMSQGSFKFKYGFYDFVPNGNRLFYKREGVLIKSDNGAYLLKTNQFKVLETIDAFNSKSEQERSFQHNLSCFADIKGLSQEGAALLDDFLESENVLKPDKIKIDVSFENAVLELKPKMDGIEQNSLESAFDLSRSIKPVYNVKNEAGERTRVIVDEQQKKQLSNVKSKRKVIDEETIRTIVENPEFFFDDDVIDLAYFSERVREIGLYKPKFYPFVCPYKSEWIPGFVIKDRLNGEKKIHFKTPVELAEFENYQKEAKSSGRSHFEYKNEEVSVDDAEKIIRNAKKQFRDTSEPAVSESEELEREEDKVLIIKENAFILEYGTSAETPVISEHSFYKIDNLVSGIQLKKHQVEGVAWMQSLFKEQVNGCLLADDMGLGKTLQLLYFIEWHAQNTDEEKPYLIVAPVSILENWEKEYLKFFEAPSLELKFLHGSSELKKEFSQNIVSKLQKKQIILTNYESLRAYQFNFCAVDYAVVALDEAQRIKTPGTLITNVSKSLKADFQIAMTGTPVENTLVDLWCIMDYCVPGLLGNAKDFAKEYQKPLMNEDTDIKELGDKVRQRIDYFLMRRLKEDVIDDLPKKHLKILKVEMPEIQANRYTVEIELAKNEELEGVERRNQILKSLWAIRDISDHPYLADSRITEYTASQLISTSAKLQIVIEELSKIKGRGEKVIIFADRRETQKMLQKVVYDTFEILPSIINGDTPASKKKATKTKLSRQQTIDRFQEKEGFNVIVMSQLAAGVGLNITGANHVIHYTRHWNPAKESQATDRAYRIGQEKDVTVYYPMAVFPSSFQNENGERQKSFDEVLHELLKRKQQLATSTLFPSEQSEIRVDDIFDNVFTNHGNPGGNSQLPLTLDEVDKLTPRLFEAFVAALYSAQGFTVRLTPFANDKGADLVALGENSNYLIQAKQSQSFISNDAVQEIVTSKGYYSSNFNENFQLAVLTNHFLGSSASTLAEANNVNSIDREDLTTLMENYPVTIQDIYTHEAQRLKQV